MQKSLRKISIRKSLILEKKQVIIPAYSEDIFKASIDCFY